MKILKHGNVKDAINRYKVICEFCGCVYEVEESEIQTTEDDEQPYKFTVCPDCGKLILFVRTIN